MKSLSLSHRLILNRLCFERILKVEDQLYKEVFKVECTKVTRTFIKLSRRKNRLQIDQGICGWSKVQRIRNFIYCKRQKVYQNSERLYEIKINNERVHFSKLCDRARLQFDSAELMINVYGVWFTEQNISIFYQTTNHVLFEISNSRVPLSLESYDMMSYFTSNTIYFY